MFNPFRADAREKMDKIDEKIQRLRREIDLDNLRMKIAQSVKKEEIHDTMSSLENGQKGLDSKFHLMISDFWQFQKAINQMHKNILHLQDLNKDVMVGKRNANCISCGTGPSKEELYGSLKHVTGNDGKLYVSHGKNVLYAETDADRKSMSPKINRKLSEMATHQYIKSQVSSKNSKIAEYA